MWSLSLFVVVLFCFVFLAGYTSFVCLEFLFFVFLPHGLCVASPPRAMRYAHCVHG